VEEGEDEGEEGDEGEKVRSRGGESTSMTSRSTSMTSRPGVRDCARVRSPIPLASAGLGRAGVGPASALRLARAACWADLMEGGVAAEVGLLVSTARRELMYNGWVEGEWRGRRAMKWVRVEGEVGEEGKPSGRDQKPLPSRSHSSVRWSGGVRWWALSHSISSAVFCFCAALRDGIWRGREEGEVVGVVVADGLEESSAEET
jgi:hypothetical protein